MAVIAIGGDDRVALLERRLHADDHRFLADIEVAEAADQPHAVHLAGALLEAPNQQHVAVKVRAAPAARRRLGDSTGLAVIGLGGCHLDSLRDCRPRPCARKLRKHGGKSAGLQPRLHQSVSEPAEEPRRRPGGKHSPARSGRSSAPVAGSHDHDLVGRDEIERLGAPARRAGRGRRGRGVSSETFCSSAARSARSRREGLFGERICG